MEGKIRTCKKWQTVYSPVLKRRVKRCAEFGEDMMEYGYEDSISSFFEDIGIDIEEVKNIAITGAIGGAGLVGISALMQKIPQIKKFIADKPLIQKLLIAGIPLAISIIGKKVAPRYSEYLNALAIAGIVYAVATGLSTGIGVPLAGIEAIEPETEGTGDEEETEAIEPETEGTGDEIDIEALNNDEIYVS